MCFDLVLQVLRAGTSLASLALIILLGQASARAEQTVPEALVDVEALWDSQNIPVCWNPGADAFPTQQQWVRDAVKSLIENPVRRVVPALG